MTRDDIIRAFHEAMSHEFDYIPADLPEHTFSPRFERKMNRLINSLKKHERAPLRTAQKVAVAIAASFIIFFTAVTQVEAIREPFINLITKIYETYIEVLFEGVPSTIITTEYQLTFVPDNFELSDMRKDEYNIYYNYTDNSNNTITFIQMSTRHTQAFIDNEQGVIETIFVSDSEVLIHKLDYCILAYWTQDGYYMKLTCIGDFNEATIISMIESVSAVDTATDEATSSTE